MRRGLFALPVPVFVFLAYNAKVPQAYEGDAVDKCGTWRGTISARHALDRHRVEPVSS